MAEVEEITITIKSSVDKKYELTVPAESTVLELKGKIAEAADVPVTSQRLIYSGRVLKDNDTLSNYKIKTGHTIHLVKSAVSRDAASSSTNTNSNNNSNTTSRPPPSAQIPTGIAAGMDSFNPLAGLDQARMSGFGPMPTLPNFEDMTEEDLDRVFDNPMVIQGFNEMINNPQMVDYLINQNPQFREMAPIIREMVQNPEIRRLILDPQMRRQVRERSRFFSQMASQQNANAFPPPGNPNDPDDGIDSEESRPNTNTNANTNANTGSRSGAGAPNPFSQLFPGGMPYGGLNPFGQVPPNTTNASNTPGQGANLLQGMDPALLQSLMFGSAGGAGAAPPTQDNRPPEERYESQLRQLNDMGFSDFDANVRALRRSGGSVQGAVENLLNGV